MTIYYVPFITTASFGMTVEADNIEEAIDHAYMGAEYPYFGGGMSGDLGDWEVDEDNIEEVEDE